MKANPGKVSPFADPPAGQTPDEVEAAHGAAEFFDQREERRRRFLSRHRRFASHQRVRQDWIAFRDIADWHASAVAADRRDQARRTEYLELAAALRNGDFDKDGRTMVLVVPAESEAFRLERNLQGDLRRGFTDADAEEVYVSAYLADAWVPWWVYRDWSAKKRDRRPSPAWRLDRDEIATAGVAVHRRIGGTPKPFHEMQAAIPKMQAAIITAYDALVGEETINETTTAIAIRNNAIRKYCKEELGFEKYGISDRSIARALRRRI